MQLVIGNKNYSSWSMRPWVLLKYFAIEFEEIRIPLFEDGFQEELALYSPTIRVPVLIDDGLMVWDSLSILEYVNEKFLTGTALPDEEEKGNLSFLLCRDACEFFSTKKWHANELSRTTAGGCSRHWLATLRLPHLPDYRKGSQQLSCAASWMNAHIFLRALQSS